MGSHPSGGSTHDDAGKAHPSVRRSVREADSAHQPPKADGSGPRLARRRRGDAQGSKGEDVGRRMLDGAYWQR